MNSPRSWFVLGAHPNQPKRTMKRIAFALVVSAAAIAATSARADTQVRIGVSFGHPGYYSPAPVVAYAPPPTVIYAAPPAVVYAPPRGYWKEVQVRTWVPERWIVRTNRGGRAERYCEPGYYTYRTDRVWVENRHDYSRGYAYSHGRDNRGWNR
jgi:hypothetical protein